MGTQQRGRGTPWPPLLAALVLGVALVGCAAPASRLQAGWEEALRGLADDGAVVAGRVLDAETGAELCTFGDVDRPMKPASNMKLLVAAIALETFGPAQRFETVLALAGDDLVIIGCGDPGLGDPPMAAARGGTPVSVLDDWASALEARDVSAVANIVYDATALEPFLVHPSWWPEDLLEWYGAPVGGLNFNDNCLDVTVIPTAPGQPVDYALSTPVDEVVIENRCVTAPAGAEPSADIRKLPGRGHAYRLEGRTAERVKLTSVPVDDPGRFLADALRSALRRRGTTVAGDLVPAEPPGHGVAAGGLETVAVHVSQLDDLVTRMNKRSQNMFADALIKMVGRAYDRRSGRPYPGSWLAGRRAVAAWFEQIGLDPLDLVMVDGSGLSHDNRVTVRMVSDLLLHMHGHPHAAAFEASLPIGGVDGTLRRRLPAFPGRVRAKTGTLTGASALSGYVTTDDGTDLVFSIIVNNAGSDAAQALQDEAVRVLITGGRPRPVAAPAAAAR